ncbi:MATE family efflux transporter [Eubacterium sp.]|uniref:MATE family efflux transporter n=1 Tax=Eubacterium sp. TaxID=142586 RepID=UPI0025E09CCB|nr:MATE family efflux transporter [Eubacterium sp.]MCR5629305.1 MATE family efflux transporter [Eubacterium sp.]
MEKNKEESVNNNKANVDSRRDFLTKTPIPELIIKLSIPTIISMLVTALYNMADTYFVGKISTQATASVGLVFSVMAIIQALGFFCGHGSGNFIARMLGAGKVKEANEMASTGFCMAMIFGIVIAVVGNIFITPLASAIGATKTSMADTKAYMSIILIGAPFMMCQFVINNQLRFQGRAVYAMVGLMCGAVFNVGLDPLLILVFDMGVRGAAIATITGQFMSFLVLLFISLRGQTIKVNIKNVRLNGFYLKEITNGGAPSLFRQGLAAAATLLLNKYAGKYGNDAAIAGMSITTRVMMMLGSAVIGFGQGYQPVCSYNYGAKLKDRVREGYFFCVKYGTIFLVFAGAVCFIFAPDIIWAFRKDEEVVAVGKVALRFQACVLPCMATTVITNMMLQSMGKGIKASITSSARSGIFFIPLILILPRVFGIRGVEVTQTIADILAMGIAIPFAVSELRIMKKME